MRKMWVLAPIALAVLAGFAGCQPSNISTTEEKTLENNLNAPVDYERIAREYREKTGKAGAQDPTKAGAAPEKM